MLGQPSAKPMTCFNPATAVRPWKTKLGMARESDLRSFNSATAVKPWKTHKSIDDAAAMNELQFGHGGEAVENFAGRSMMKAREVRFNSATAVRPWKTG